MSTEESAGLTRASTTLFSATSVVAAIVVGSMLISGWHAGILDNRIEWLFWAGAIIAVAGIGALGLACISAVGPAPRPPEGAQRTARSLRVGVALFLAGPVLCVIAVFTNYWI